jgi:hypothetical protein
MVVQVDNSRLAISFQPLFSTEEELSWFIHKRVFEAVERVEGEKGGQGGVDGLSEALDGWVKRSRRGAWREAGAGDSVRKA